MSPKKKKTKETKETVSGRNPRPNVRLPPKYHAMVNRMAIDFECTPREVYMRAVVYADLLEKKSKVGELPGGHVDDISSVLREISFRAKEDGGKTITQKLKEWLELDLEWRKHKKQSKK